jgi:hypothetical protein
MRNKNLLNCCLFILYLLFNCEIKAQDSAVKSEKEYILNVNYFSLNNKVPYILVETQSKLNNRYSEVRHVPVKVFLDSDSGESGLLGKITTNEKGVGKLVFPVSVKDIWEKSAQHKLIAIADSSTDFEETKTEVSVTKSKISIDTATEDGVKNITVTFSELKDGKWVPVKDVDLKVGIRRLGSQLPVGEEESYTTDSAGQVIAEFKKDSLPGDAKGNLTLVVKVDKNENYGSLEQELMVPWGIYKNPGNNFTGRTLWATGNRSPLWLLWMAILIVAGIWGVFIYLILQLIKIRKMGRGIVLTD